MIKVRKGNVMPIKKPKAKSLKPIAKSKSAVRAPAKKNAVAPAKASVNNPSLLSWLFVAAKPIDWKKYSLRIILSVIGFFAAMSILTAMMIKMNFAMHEMETLSSFWQRLAVFPMSFIADFMMHPVQSIFTLLSIALIGAFVFMPRQTLDRRGFVAAHILGVFLALLAIVPIYLTSGRISTYLLAIVMFFGGLLSYAGAVGYARGEGLSKWATILSFPFGYSFLFYSGMFLPQTKSGPSLRIKFDWYSKLLDFLLLTTNGLIVLVAAEVLSLIIFPYPWAILFGIIFASLALSIGRDKIYENLNGFVWMSAILNVAMLIGVVALFELRPYYAYILG
jgi:hypothetical protein